MTFSNGYEPRLTRSSLILPSKFGWTIQTGSRVVIIRSRRLSRLGDDLLDLFDGNHSLRAISKQTRVPLEELHRLIGRLSRLNLLETNPYYDLRPENRHPSLDTPTQLAHPSRKLCPLLLFGLGELGLTVLHELLQHRPKTVYIFDPVPVQAVDLAPFYRPSDLGLWKDDVVWRCLGRDGQSIVQRLDRRCGDREAVQESLHDAIGKVGVVVCCVDRPSQLAEYVSSVCASAGIPLVAAELSEEGGSVGPIQTPNGGCISCAHLYQSEGDQFSSLTREYLRNRFPQALRWRSSVEPWLIEMIAGLALIAAFQAVDRSTGPAANRSMRWELNSRPFEIAAQAVPKHHGCYQCFPAAVRGFAQLRDQAMRDWEQRWKCAPAEPMELLELRRRLQRFTGESFSLFRSCHQESSDQRRAVYRFCNDRGANPRDNLVANAFRAAVERPDPRGVRVSAFAEGSDFHDGRMAEALALIEGIERLFALEQRDPRRISSARYTDVASQALDPTSFPLYAKDQYAQPGFGLRRFDPGQSIEWIWGMRISDSQPVLVPVDLVFGSHGAPTLYRANSNGASCHSSFHRAVLGGIYETVERDSLMVAWMNRLSLPVLGPSGGGIDIAAIRRDFKALSLELTCVDITTNLGIPAVLGVLTDKLNPDFLIVDPVASLHPPRIGAKLGRELTQFCRPYLSDPHCYTNRVSASSDPRSVKKLPDHLSYYQNRKKIKRAHFLTSGPNRRDRMLSNAAVGPMGIEEELRIVTGKLSQCGHEVVVVDCSVPLIRDLGLYTVKVLIPGLQPLHVGHRYAALGGTRLYQAPRLMGLARRDRSRAQLNPWPHPFW